MQALSKFLRQLPDGQDLLKALGIVVAFLLLVAATVGAIVLYPIISPPRLGQEVPLSSLLGNPSEVSYTGPDGKMRQGWFFPGLRNAPAIILCPGYGSHRGEMLTLVTALQENQYNVFLLDFPGHGYTEGFTTLGFAEAGELRAALQALVGRDDIDSSRIGVWGTDMGAYAALTAAAGEPRILAVVADSALNTPLDLLRVQTERSAIGGIPMVVPMARWMFLLMNFSYRNEPPLAARVGQMDKVAKLFISADPPGPAESTRALYDAAAEPRQFLSFVKKGYALMPEAEKREYDNQVAGFFLTHLSPLPSRPR